MSTPKYNFKAKSLIQASRINQSNIEEIRTWLKNNPNYPPLSDEQIVLFLLSCDNHIENTINTIQAYYKHRSNCPEFFTKRDAFTEEFHKNFLVAEMARFPKYTKENYAVIFSRLRDTSYYNFNLDQQVKQLFMVLDTVLYTNPPDGLVVIFDMKGIGLMHLTRLKLGLIKRFFAYLQEALPCQLRQIHILNTSYILDKVLALCKPFMKKELIDMLITHAPNVDMNEFYEKYVASDVMPVDYGGELPTVKEMNENILNDFKLMKEFFELEEKQTQLYKKVK